MIMTQGTQTVSLKQSIEKCRSDSLGRFIELRTPLLYPWVERMKGKENNQFALARETLGKPQPSISIYPEQPPSSFRNWLYAVFDDGWGVLIRKKKLLPIFANEHRAILSHEDSHQGSLANGYRTNLLRPVYEVVACLRWVHKKLFGISL